MICPFCNSRVPDGSPVCPACRADLLATSSIAPPEGSYCPSCGALVPGGAESCPACGLPVQPQAGAPEPPGWASSLPEVEEPLDLSAQETTVIPRIESAISAEGEYRADAAEARPVRRTFPVLLVALLALVVVGGAFLAVAHPWDPNAFDQRSITGTDTSHAGFPGVVETLSGQDSTPSDASGEVVSGDEATYGRLLDIYGRLGELAGLVDENVSLFREVAVSGTGEERADAAAQADALAIEVSNLLAELDLVDLSSGTYDQDAANLSTLGNWLRNRCDTLCAAWVVSLSYDDPSQARQEVLAALAVDDNSLGRNAYMSLFHDSYDGWAPQPPQE